MADSNITVSQYHPAFVIAISALMCLLSLITVAGNLMVMVSFYIDKNIRQPSNYFIFSLAISDFIIGLEGFPLYSVYVLQGSQWTMGWFICDLWLSIDYTVCLASTYTVLFITIDRYCSVRIPTSYRNWRTKWRVSVIIIIIWIIPALLFFISVFGWSYFSPHGRTVPENECYVQFMEDPIFNMSMYISYYWSTLVVMIGLYAGIYRTAKNLQKKSEQRQKRLSAMAAMRANVAPIGVCLSPLNKQDSVKRHAILAKLSSTDDQIDEETQPVPEVESGKNPTSSGPGGRGTVESFTSNSLLIPITTRSTLTPGTGEGAILEISKSSSIHSSDLIEQIDEQIVLAQNNNQEEEVRGSANLGMLMKRAKFRATAAAVRLFQRRPSLASVSSEPLTKTSVEKPGTSPTKRRFSEMLIRSPVNKGNSEPTLLRFQSFDYPQNVDQKQSIGLSPPLAPRRRSSGIPLEQIEEYLEDDRCSDQVQEGNRCNDQVREGNRYNDQVQESNQCSDRVQEDLCSDQVQEGDQRNNQLQQNDRSPVPDQTIEGNRSPAPDYPPPEPPSISDDTATVNTPPVVSAENSAIECSGPTNGSMIRRIPSSDNRYLSASATPKRRRYSSGAGISTYNDISDIRYSSSLTMPRKSDKIRYIDSESLISTDTTMSTLASRSGAGKTMSLNLSSHSSSNSTTAVPQRSSNSTYRLSSIDPVIKRASTNEMTTSERRKDGRCHSADCGTWRKVIIRDNQDKSRFKSDESGGKESNVVLVSEVKVSSDRDQSIRHSLKPSSDTDQWIRPPQEHHSLVPPDQRRDSTPSRSVGRMSIFQSSPLRMVKDRLFRSQPKVDRPNSKCELIRAKAPQPITRNVSFDQGGRNEEIEDEDEEDEDNYYSSTGAPYSSCAGSAGKHYENSQSESMRKISATSRSQERRRLLTIPTRNTLSHGPSMRSHFTSSIYTTTSAPSEDSGTLRESTLHFPLARESSKFLTGFLGADTTKRLRNGAAGVAEVFRHHRRKGKEKVRKSKSENRAKKALRTITFILGAFVLFWTPFYVLATIHGFNKQLVPDWLYTMSYYMCYLNSPINPFCYAMANVQFKKAFVRMLRGDFHRI